ncbi:hypothetical protein BDN70DRAFT_888768 [Pholiota conissans]|uniref:Uncharacterized protein n=1 Tax=Pholiota conissans TaxID=109636 RepID=A0A9P5YL34_9AGAR|nr:hypothetical protein BDN70DRAFT_888768 [Pholiota conissans]
MLIESNLEFNSMVVRNLAFDTRQHYALGTMSTMSQQRLTERFVRHRASFHATLIYSASFLITC